MTIHVTPIPSTIDLTAPAFTLGTTNTAGAAVTAVSSNSTLLTFDAVSPATVAGTAVVGTATVVARRDHVHIGVSPSGAVFSAKVDLGTNLLVGNDGSTGIGISAAGEVNMAAQPAFLANPTNDATNQNVTGDGSLYPIVFDVEVFDQNADFDGASTFTAPIAGRYRGTARIRAGGLAVGHTDGIFMIRTTIQDFAYYYDPYALGTAANVSSAQVSQLMNMANTNTAIAYIQITGGAKSVDLGGGASLTDFSVELTV